jgi:hypothetical protein
MDSRGGGTKQHSISVAQRKCSGSDMPGLGDLWSGIDTGQHRGQPAFANQPVEGTTQLRMISSYNEPAASPQQQLDLIAGVHINKMRTSSPTVRRAPDLWMSDRPGTTVVDA